MAYSFQSRSNFIHQAAVHFHDYTIVVLTTVIISVLLILADIIILGYRTKAFIDYSLLEIWWTLIPAVTLLFIVAPSLKLLYSIDSMELPDISLRVLGHQ